MGTRPPNRLACGEWVQVAEGWLGWECALWGLVLRTVSCPFGSDSVDGKSIEPIGRLVPLSCARYRAYTCGLLT
jgi:hypothetical protein